MSSMDEPIPGAELVVPDPDDIMHFNILIKPTDGLYKGATFKFTVEIPNSYPYDPPKVRCTTLVRFVSLLFFSEYMLLSQFRSFHSCASLKMSGLPPKH